MSAKAELLRSLSVWSADIGHLMVVLNDGDRYMRIALNVRGEVFVSADRYDKLRSWEDGYRAENLRAATSPVTDEELRGWLRWLNTNEAPQ